jgi:Anticodon binding domain
MRPLTSPSMLGVPMHAATLTCLATNASCQSLDSILNAADKAKLDLSATRIAQKIRESRLTGKPKALVIDFCRGRKAIKKTKKK